MARTFNGSTQAADGTSVIGAAPVSIAAWFKSGSITAEQFIAGVRMGATRTGHFLTADGSTGGDPVCAFSRTGAGAVQATTSSGFSSGVWHHGCATFASGGANRSAYIDGGNKGTNSATRNPSTATPVNEIGAAVLNGDRFFSGDIGEIAIWDVELTDAEVAMLATGICPLLVRPASIVHYFPFIGKYSPEIDIVGGLGLTLYNSPVAAAHPRFIGYGRR